ncbi:hypothetical protein HPB47_002266, partial [Ixodes persulcatus]
ELFFGDLLSGEPQFGVGRLQYRSSATVFSAFKEMVAVVGLRAASLAVGFSVPPHVVPADRDHGTVGPETVDDGRFPALFLVPLRPSGFRSIQRAKNTPKTPPRRHHERNRDCAQDFSTVASGQRLALKDKQSKEMLKDGNEERKKWQQFFVHAKRSTNDIPDRMLDRRAIWENRELKRNSKRFPEDEDENERDKVQEHKKEKEKEFETIKGRYLWILKKKRAPRPQQVFFDWNASENTALDCNPIYKDRHTAQFYEKEQSKFYGEPLKRRWTQAEKDQEVLRLKKVFEGHAGADWRIFKEDFNITIKGGRITNPLRRWDESQLKSFTLDTIKEPGYKSRL